jgi:ribonuclease BN (tRNA processing enzyme)
MNELVVVGCSSGMPSGLKSNSAFLFRTEWGVFLVDCGEGTSASMRRLRIDFDRLQTVFITHAHPDHCAGLPLLIQMMYLAGRKKPLDIYMPKELMTPMRVFMDGTYIFKEKMGFKFNFIPLKPNPAFRKGKLSLSIYPSRHLYGYTKLIKTHGYKNRMQSYIFSLNLKGKKIVYSGDLANFDDVESLIDDADLLIIEGMHIDLKSLWSGVVQKRVKRVMLTHLPDLPLSRLERIKSQAERHGVKKLILAEDGLRIRI